MLLSQFVVRCVTAPFRTAVRRPASHHAAHHIGRLGHLPLHRIAAVTRPAFSLACRYVPIAIGLGSSALVPPVAIWAPSVPAVASPLIDGAGNDGGPGAVPGMFGGPGSGSENFGPQDAAEQASSVAPSSAPFEATIGTSPAPDSLPWFTLTSGSDEMQQALSTTNTPAGVTAVPIIPPTQSVPEPSTVVLLPGLLTVLLHSGQKRMKQPS
jgi:hypothetical protein